MDRAEFQRYIDNALQAGNIAAEAMRAATAQVATTTATFETITTTAYNGGFYLHDASTSTYLPYCGVFDILTGGGRRKKNRIKEDAELSAGDTKAMDELLDGFAIKQNLQQA